MSIQKPLLEVKAVSKEFSIPKNKLSGGKRSLKAVRDVSFTLEAGETLGIVGESGCGKSTLARLVMHLYDLTEGDIFFDGQNTKELKGESLRRIRSKFQMIFQDPYASFNPRMNIRKIMEEPLKYHNVPKEDWNGRVEELLGLVNMPLDALERYPHEFSGGQRQRISIARALLLNPKLIVADEPVAALDVSIQAQVLNLLRNLKEKLGLSMLFISHNLATVEYISNRIAVMYLGKIIELADAKELCQNPLHPYTKLLISAIPTNTPKERGQGKRIEGELPDPINPPKGCPFSTRCPEREKTCEIRPQSLKEVSSGHFVACRLYG